MSGVLLLSRAGYRKPRRRKRALCFVARSRALRVDPMIALREVAGDEHDEQSNKATPANVSRSVDVTAIAAQRLNRTGRSACATQAVSSAAAATQQRRHRDCLFRGAEAIMGSVRIARHAGT